MSAPGPVPVPIPVSVIVMTRTASPATAAAGIATTRGVPVLLIGPQPVKDQPAAGAR